MFKGFQIGTLGVDLGSIKNSIREIASLGGNTIRYQIVAPDPRYMGKLDQERDYRWWSFLEYEKFWWAEIQKIKECAQMIEDERLKIKIIIDCHSPFGGAHEFLAGNKHLIIIEDFFRHKWTRLWLETVKATHMFKSIVGYDLCNEPAATTKEWAKVARGLARKIRQQERVVGSKTKWIFITTPGGSVSKFKQMPKIDVPKVSFQAHFYFRKDITEKTILKELRPALRYARKHRAPLYFGEIGCSRKNGESQVNDFFSTVLPILHSQRAFRRPGGGYTIHAYNESRNFNYKNTEAMNIIKGYFNE